MKKRIFAGVTEDKELYFLEVETTTRNGYNEFTMSGFTVKPVTEEEKEEYENNYLDGEELYFWKQAVQADGTTLSLDDWIEEVREGGDHMDTSLYPYTSEVEGETYYFESQSCGQHEVDNLVYYAIPKATFKKYMQLWKTYHLKPVDKMTPTDRETLSKILGNHQNEESAVIKAVEYII